MVGCALLHHVAPHWATNIVHSFRRIITWMIRALFLEPRGVWSEFNGTEPRIVNRTIPGWQAWSRQNFRSQEHKSESNRKAENRFRITNPKCNLSMF